MRLFEAPPVSRKRCAKCGQLLPLTCFSRSRDRERARRGELRRDCKNCDRLREPFWPVGSEPQ